MSLRIFKYFVVMVCAMASLGVAESKQAIGILEFANARTYLTVPRIDASFASGDHLPLIQKNVDYFIALVPSREGNQLAAFPITDWRKQPSAWVTQNKDLVFSKPTQAVKGRFYPFAGEKLLVVDSDERNYTVHIARYGNAANLLVPKRKRGIVFYPGSAEAPPSGPPRTVAPAPRVEGQSVRPETSPPNNTTPKAAPSERPPKAVPPARTPDTAHRETEASEDTLDHGDILDQMDQSTSLLIALARELDQHAMIYKLLLLVAIVQAVFITRINRRNKTLINVIDPVQPALTLPPVDPNALESLYKLHEGESFTGSLRVFSVPELVQIIHSAEETGILNLQCDQTGARGKIFFRDGRIIDADYAKREPEEAVYAMLDMAKGGFSFLRSNRVPDYRRIQKETIAMLIAASHRRDEQRERNLS